MLRVPDLTFDSIIPVRRSTASTVRISGVMDTQDAAEVAFLVHRGLVGSSTAAHRVTFKESDTVSATASGMTAISLSSIVGPILSTATQTKLVTFNMAGRKRFIGLLLSLSTKGTQSGTVGVLGLKLRNRIFPKSSTQDFTSVSHN